MATSRHPAYRSQTEANRWRSDMTPAWFDLVDSTEAARIVRRHPHDPLFARYDSLRAAGLLRPAQLDPTVRFYRGDCERYMDGTLPAEPDPDENPLAPMRGVIVGGLIGGILLFAAVLIGYAVFK